MLDHGTAGAIGQFPRLQVIPFAIVLAAERCGTGELIAENDNRTSLQPFMQALEEPLKA